MLILLAHLTVILKTEAVSECPQNKAYVNFLSDAKINNKNADGKKSQSNLL